MEVELQVPNSAVADTAIRVRTCRKAWNRNSLPKRWNPKRPLTLKISSVILLTVCYMNLVTLVRNILYWINNPLIDIFLGYHHLSVWCIDIVSRNSVLVSLIEAKGLNFRSVDKDQCTFTAVFKWIGFLVLRRVGSFKAVFNPKLMWNLIADQKSLKEDSV